MAALILDGVRIYGAIGLAVAAIFLTVGIGRVMDSARGAFLFRPLLVPGIVLLWPVVALRWLALERGRTSGAGVGTGAFRPPLRAQKAAMFCLVIAVPMAIAVALLARQDGPLEAPAVLIEAPASEARQP